VRLGIEHGTSNTSASEEQDSTSNNNADCPWGKEGSNNEHGLLTSVAEVVVSTAHVVEGSSLVHFDQTTIEVRSGSCVQLHAVLFVLLGSISIVVVLCQQLSLSQTTSLVQEGHVLSQPLALEHGSVRAQPCISSWVGKGESLDLNDVASVSLVSTLTSISCRVGVASSPLEVNVVANVHSQVFRNKVVFSGRVGFNDVASFAADVQVVDFVSRGNS